MELENQLRTIGKLLTLKVYLLGSPRLVLTTPSITFIQVDGVFFMKERERKMGETYYANPLVYKMQRYLFH